jgi:hypothetical protein
MIYKFRLNSRMSRVACFQCHVSHSQPRMTRQPRISSFQQQSPVPPPHNIPPSPPAVACMTTIHNNSSILEILLHNHLYKQSSRQLRKCQGQPLRPLKLQRDTPVPPPALDRQSATARASQITLDNHHAPKDILPSRKLPSKSCSIIRLPRRPAIRDLWVETGDRYASENWWRRAK